MTETTLEKSTKIYLSHEHLNLSIFMWLLTSLSADEEMKKTGGKCKQEQKITSEEFYLIKLNFTDDEASKSTQS